MRRFYFILLIIFCLSGCEESPFQNLTTGMTAEIDGESWTSITRATVLTDAGFTITATSVNGEVLILTILGDSTGVYDLNLSTAKCGALYKESISQATNDAFASSTGQIILDEVDESNNKITGTFTFQLRKDLSTSVIEVTNGEFNNLTYTVSPK